MTLLKNGLFKAAEYIIRCGWQLHKERGFSSLKILQLAISDIDICGRWRQPDVRNSKDQFLDFLDNIDKGPKSLYIMCRKIIRQQLITASKGAEIETNIKILPIPSKIQAFLALKDFLHDKEIIKLENRFNVYVGYDESSSDVPSITGENDTTYRDEVVDYY
ncbi:uncharacterized protein LOC134684403 [Mytilus trossulus]|uniref:uncharacterized protein LOC134684403 n=1 Tax=Mytilus trossulus TaxID=6551 RepID=UPI00300685B0